MRYTAVKQLLRRHVKSDRVWSTFRRALVTYQYFARDPDEPELRIFGAQRRQGGLSFADIGANGGQTAVAIARILPTATIDSFEPNPTVWSELDWVGRMIGSRFRQHRFGLGAETGQVTLYVPYAGDLPVTTRASLLPEVAASRANDLAAETGLRSDVRPMIVDVKRFDDLGLCPAGAKIDVEGVEYDVLRGMVDTLSSCRPLLMLEYSDQTEECKDLLRSFGYDYWNFDLATKALVQHGVTKTRNWFAVPRSSPLREALGLPPNI